MNKILIKLDKEDKNLILFFIIAFFWSYLFWGLEIFTGKRFYVAPFGPTLSAFFLTFINKGWQGVKELLKKGFNLKFNKVWLVPTFLLMPAIIGLSLLLAILFGEKIPEMTALKQPYIIIPAFFMIFFLGGPLAEEFGWRGYALDRLQKRFNATFSSIILGLIWGAWHLPLFFMKDQQIYKNIPIPAFIIGTILLSTLFTWIYNNTNRSILTVLIFHTMGNLSHFVFPATSNILGGLFSLILNLIATIIIVIVFGARNFSKHDINISELSEQNN